MSDENEDLPLWRKKFLAARMAFESILFERELVVPRREKLSTGLLGLAGIWLFHALLLAQWVFRRGSSLGQADAENFGGLLRYAAYFKRAGFWALVKPEIADLTLNPPFYSLSYVPVFRYLTADPVLALVLVNSFYLLVLALAVFLAVRKSRPNRAGWLGAAFALAFPFVLETARRPAPEMALLALAAALYACYINSEEFERPKWTFAFAVCLGLGFFSHRFFWLYALPLVPFILAGFASPYSRDELFKGFFPGAVLNLPWYLFILTAAAAGFAQPRGEYLGFWHYFGLGVSAAGLPLFLIGFAGLAWMYFSVFMPYEKRKAVAAWFWAPYLLLAWLVRGSHPQLLYPALLPFAVAVPVMTPHQARRYLLVFALALGAVNQSGLLSTVSLAGFPAAGLPAPSAEAYRVPEITALAASCAPAAGGLAGVYGDAKLNARVLRFAALRFAAPLKFSDAPACPGCASVLIHKTPRGEKPSKNEEAFSALKAQPWFSSVFSRRAELRLADASSAEVYVKVPSSRKFLEEGAHQVRNLSLGPLKIEEASLKLAGFDPATGVYSSAVLFAPSAELLGGDIYGLTLEISGLSAAGAALDPFVPSGLAGIRVRSAKISAYSVERYLEKRCPFLSGLKVSLDKTLGISAMAGGRELSAEFALSIKNGGVLEARPLAFRLGPLSLPGFLLKLYTFRNDFSGAPYGVKLSGLRIGGEMVQLY